MTTRATILALTILGVLLTACPKREDATARPAAADTGVAKGPDSIAHGPAAMEPRPKAANDAPPAAGETVIHYRWSGGLSIYHFYTLTIRGTDTAMATFVVKPARGDEKRVEEPLDAAQFSELKDLLEKASFDKIGEKPRGVRISDIGQTVISREGGGHAKKEVFENGQTTVDGDIAALKAWLDTHVRTYLEKSGAAPVRPLPKQ